MYPTYKFENNYFLFIMLTNNLTEEEIEEFWGINISLADKLKYDTPRREDVFNAFKYFKPKDTKICILGEEPYPKAAMGMAFSSKLAKTPGSLRNIFKVLTKTYNIPFDKNDLTNWAMQGVLLINCYLTYPNKPKVWDVEINKLITKLSNNNKNIVWLLWGNFAKSKKKFIKTGLILEHDHPSPANGNKFLTCNHFEKVDKYLSNKYNIKKAGKNMNLNIPNKLINWDLNYVIKERLCVGFTDGSWRPSVKAASWAVYFPDEVYGHANALKGFRRGTINEKTPFYKHRTNIFAEGLAIVKTLQIFNLVRSYPFKFQFYIVTDSKFWCDVLLKGWNMKVKHNEYLLNKMLKFLERFNVNFYFIKSHKKKMKEEYLKDFYDMQLKKQQKINLVKEFQENNCIADELATELTKLIV